MFSGSDCMIKSWKMDSETKLNKKSETVAHQRRILQLTQSPDQDTLLSAGGDESLRFW